MYKWEGLEIKKIGRCIFLQKRLKICNSCEFIEKIKTTAPIFSEVFNWGKEKFEYSIFDSVEFLNLSDITQVYGFIFNKKGKILIIKSPERSEWSLPGGGPEKCDKNWKETLIREVIEEADVEIKRIIPLFYLSAKRKAKKKSKGKEGIMLRAMAKVDKINQQTIDPATGKINERKFISQKDFLKYCPWGENGKVQLNLAIKKRKEIIKKK